MKMKKRAWIACFLCVGFLLGACEEKEREKETIVGSGENDAEMVLKEGKEGDSTQPEGSIDVAIMGVSWENQKNVTFTTTDWEKALPKDHRFVLIDTKETITQEKQKILQTWLEADKVVLFYGENVQPEEVKEKIGMEVGVIEVKTSASFDFPYLLYGYGFSMTYEQYLPIFLSSNTVENFEEKIATFLLKNKNF